MASDDTAKLVVALEARFDKFEKSLNDSTKVADKAVSNIEARFAQMNKTISSQLQSVAAGYANNLGLIGPIITALGPAGIAAAAGLGLVAGAIYAIVNATNEWAIKQKALKEGAETAGLTISQFKLLGGVGKSVGLDFDESSAFFTKFIANLEQLRHGSGTLYDALLKVDVGLLRELSTTKDSARAIDILVAAFARLDNQTDKLNIAKGAGGRAGLQGVRLLEQLSKVGGLSGLEATSPKIDEGQVERAVKLRNEIEKIKRDTENIWGRMFSDQTLEQERAMADDLKKIAEFIERIVGAKEKAARLSNPAGAAGDDLTKEKADLEAQLKAIEDRKAQDAEHLKYLKDVGASQKQIYDDLPGLKQLEQAYDKVSSRLKEINEQLERMRGQNGGVIPSAVAAAEETVKRPVNFRAAREGISEPAPPSKTEGSAAVELAILQKHISLLGDAVTQTEQWKAKRLELKAAAEADPTVNGIANRALAAFNLTMKQAALSARERLGIAREEEIVTVGLAKLQQDRAKGFIRTDAEMVLAEQILRKEAKATAESLQVRASNLPQLTQYVLDSNNSLKQLDSIAVSSLGNLENAFADAVTGAKSLQDAIKDLASSAARDLAKLAFRSILGSLLGPFMPGLTGLVGGGNAFLPGKALLNGNPTGLAEGTDNWRGGPTWVGEKGPEIINLPRGAQVIPNDVAGTKVGGSVTVAPVFHVDATGADAAQIMRLERALVRTAASIKPLAIQAVAEHSARFG